MNNCVLVGNQAILTGDTDGHVVAFSPYAHLWRLRLADNPHLKVHLTRKVLVTTIDAQ